MNRIIGKNGVVNATQWERVERDDLDAAMIDRRVAEKRGRVTHNHTTKKVPEDAWRAAMRKAQQN